MKRIVVYMLSFVLFTYCTEDKNDQAPEPEKVTTLLADGPYLMYEANKLVAYRITNQGHLETEDMNRNEVVEVVAPKQTPAQFEFQLMSEHANEPSVSSGNPVLFVVSDIEGNYYALSKLLIGNGVTDANLNWTFGKKHLVVVGDMVDRGSYVTQVLWLLYKLEREAKAAGGQVHFVLGNHDIMCMAGDDRYASDKYLNVARKLKVNYKELYGQHSEIGRWMRTKNAIEKIGDYLFVHGGISPAILNLKLSVEEMNAKLRPYYGQVITGSAPSDVQQLFGTAGLFWYRGYVKEKEGAYAKASPQEVMEILTHYQVRSIIVGHCIVDQIEANYEGAVITVDVEHPEAGYSGPDCQALLIEDGKMYRVDEKAERIVIHQ